MNQQIKELLQELTLDEKVSLFSGTNFWRTKEVERLGIPSILLADGPHGLRKQNDNGDHLGINESVASTCFPTASCLASSWDRELVRKVGESLGRECQAEGVSILLGPGANIKRSPLCGRNFEYFSEDPLVSSELAASYIEGVQSQGVGTSLKHFAANNQEHRRMSVDAVIDERTLREIYLASFEGAVKKGKPWTVMSSYNKVNGTYASENKKLLSDILRDEWGHEGIVVSDWGAVNERAESLEAGLELEMPSSYGNGAAKILEAVRQGKLSEHAVDRAAEKLLTVIMKATEKKRNDVIINKEKHHQIAKEAATESIILLKNENGILPLKKEQTVAVIGELSKKPRFQGGGSSHVNPVKLDKAYDCIDAMTTSALYAAGYQLENDEPDERLIEEAVQTAAKADVCVIFAGLPDRFESEAFDRTHLNIPLNQQKVIEAVSVVQENIIVVLSNGAPIEMPWIEKVKGVIEGYLGGQAAGSAMADILFGEANPSGKLAETFPQHLQHNPSYLSFPGEGDKAIYHEGIFVGYRYYDAKRIQPLFPFGHGLSYTTFEYTSMTLSKKEISESEELTVSITVKNTGTVYGKEIVQLYVRDEESSVIRPDKELKGFQKVALHPGEEKTVDLTLDNRAFAFYDSERSDWHTESGEFVIMAGQSSRSILLQERIRIHSCAKVSHPGVTRNSLIGDILMHDERAAVLKATLQDVFKGSAAAEASKTNSEMFQAMRRYLPLRGLVGFKGDTFTENKLSDLIDRLNQID